MVEIWLAMHGMMYIYGIRTVEYSGGVLGHALFGQKKFSHDHRVKIKPLFDPFVNVIVF